MTAVATIVNQTPDINVLKARMKNTWESGNWDYFSRFMESSSEQFLDRLNLSTGKKLLDVACGSGGLCLMASRRGLDVTGVDIASNSIQAARGRARSEGLEIRFDEGDAEGLPYPNNSFDYVTSIFGAMFAPRPDLVATELVRVCRPGGTIAMGNWAPSGFIGQMFKLVSAAMPPTGVPSPALWGDEATVTKRLRTGLSHLEMEHVFYRFDYPLSPEDVTEFFRANYGPIHRAHAVLPTAEWTKLRDQLTEHFATYNLSGKPNRTTVDGAYLHVVATKA